MSFVLDASATLAWIFLRQDPVEAALADQWLLRLKAEDGIVPALWEFEVGNALLVAERRGVVNAEQSATFLSHVAALPITVAHGPSLRRSSVMLDIGRRHGLSVYDASYLALALSERLPIATFDGKLRRACALEGLSVP